MITLKLSKPLIFMFMISLIIGCNKNSVKGGKGSSQATGWKINSKDGGFQSAAKYKGQPAGPGLFIAELIVMANLTLPFFPHQLSKPDL